MRLKQIGQWKHTVRDLKYGITNICVWSTYVSIRKQRMFTLSSVMYFCLNRRSSRPVTFLFFPRLNTNTSVYMYKFNWRCIDLVTFQNWLEKRLQIGICQWILKVKLHKRMYGQRSDNAISMLMILFINISINLTIQ
jgi:hypothetical protein